MLLHASVAALREKGGKTDTHFCLFLLSPLYLLVQAPQLLLLMYYKSPAHKGAVRLKNLTMSMGSLYKRLRTHLFFSDGETTVIYVATLEWMWYISSRVVHRSCDLTKLST